MKTISKAILKYFKNTDKLLLSFCLGCSTYSCVMLYGLVLAEKTRMGTLKTQIVASILGVLCAIIVSKIDYEFMCRLWKLHAPATYFLVILTFIVGEGRADATYVDDRAWLRLPFVNMTIQPSELLKISFIITFAYHLSQVKDKINQPKTLIMLCLHGGLPLLLVNLQGDNGTALLFAFIMICMLFSAGISWRYIGAAFGASVVATPLLWFFVLSDDKKNRLVAIINPADAPAYVKHQQTLGQIAIGSGQISGKGLFGQNFQNVPEVKNDFIFSFAGEAFGFLGTMLVILLIGGICVKILYNTKMCRDDMGKLLCVGVFAMIAGQAVINIGMNISVIPVIGVTLPLFSAGGTSVVTTYLGIGIALSVYYKCKSNMFLGK